MPLVRRRYANRSQGFWHGQLVRRGLTVLGILIGAYLIFPIIFGEMGLITYLKMRRTYSALSIEISILSDQNSKIEQEIQGLRSDPLVIEKLARGRLGLVRPGETVFRFEKGSPPVGTP